MRTKYYEQSSMLYGRQEDVYHFSFVCKNYSNVRNTSTLFDCLFVFELVNIYGTPQLSYVIVHVFIIYAVNIDIYLLLCGDVDLPSIFSTSGSHLSHVQDNLQFRASNETFRWSCSQSGCSYTSKQFIKNFEMLPHIICVGQN